MSALKSLVIIVALLYGTYVHIRSIMVRDAAPVSAAHSRLIDCEVAPCE